jgi:hypothetical protein
MFEIGDRVIKHIGDHRIEGVVRAVFQTGANGQTHYVVAHETPCGGRFCHIFSAANLRLYETD